MKNQKSILSALSLFIILAILSSCSTSNEVVSNNFITKRKFNKGFHIDFKKRYHSEKESNLTKKDVKEIEVVNEEKEIFENQLISASNFENSIELDSPLNLELETKNRKPNLKLQTSSLNLEHFVSKHQTSLDSGKDLKTKKSSSKIAKHTLKEKRTIIKNPAKKIDTNTLLLVILCFILSPLAVFLHQGSWNTNCWINLILYILFILPGLIHGLYVILVA
jgi:uncharacterized membrane protein YqaE (UPF0057 family)